MKQEYVEIRFKRDSLKLIELSNAIIADYIEQGFKLTVRQLYYQLVARGHIENTEKSYKRITSLVNDARLAGVMDWDVIEDRTRDFIKRPRWNSGRDILDGCARQFHMDMWENQDRRVFVVVEKEALVGLLEGVCYKYDVPILAARGYPSVSVIREFAMNDLIGESPLILHLGDHDPSGIDMTRDLIDRLSLLSDCGDFDLQRIALNMKQIESQNPPPNPAKSTDSRFVEYRRKFGVNSWELDALSPKFLNDLVEKAILKQIDKAAWLKREQEIFAIKKKIAELAKKI